MLKFIEKCAGTAFNQPQPQKDQDGIFISLFRR